MIPPTEHPQLMCMPYVHALAGSVDSDEMSINDDHWLAMFLKWIK